MFITGSWGILWQKYGGEGAWVGGGGDWQEASLFLKTRRGIDCPLRKSQEWVGSKSGFAWVGASAPGKGLPFFENPKGYRLPAAEIPRVGRVKKGSGSGFVRRGLPLSILGEVSHSWNLLRWVGFQERGAPCQPPPPPSSFGDGKGKKIKR